MAQVGPEHTLAGARPAGSLARFLLERTKPSSAATGAVGTVPLVNKVDFGYQTTTKF